MDRTMQGGLDKTKQGGLAAAILSDTSSKSQRRFSFWEFSKNQAWGVWAEPNRKVLAAPCMGVWEKAGRVVWIEPSRRGWTEPCREVWTKPSRGSGLNQAGGFEQNHAGGSGQNQRQSRGSVLNQAGRFGQNHGGRFGQNQAGGLAAAILSDTFSKSQRRFSFWTFSKD